MANTATFDLSKESIFNACNKLQAQGIKITTESVRAEIGGGSFNVMLPLIKEWKSQHSSKASSPDIQLPESAITAVTKAANLIWKTATDHQAEAINAIRQDCNRIEQEALGERDEALKEIQKLEEKIKSLEGDLNAVETKHTEQAAKIADLSLSLQKQDLELTNEYRRYEELKTQMLDLAQTAEGRQNAITEEKNALSLEIEKQRLTLDTAAKSYEELKAKTKELEKKLETVQNTATSKANSLELQINSQQLALDSSNKTSEELKAEVKELRAKTEAAQHEAAKLAGMLEAYKTIKPEPKRQAKPAAAKNTD